MSDAVSQAARDARERRLREGPQCSCSCPYVRMTDNVWVCRLCGLRSLRGGRTNTENMHREFYSLLTDELEPHRLEGAEAPAVLRLLEGEGYAVLDYVHNDGPISYVRVRPTDEGLAFAAGYRDRRLAHRTVHGHDPGVPATTEVVTIDPETMQRGGPVPLPRHLDPRRQVNGPMHEIEEFRRDFYARLSHATRRAASGDRRSAQDQLLIMLAEVAARPEAHWHHGSPERAYFADEVAAINAAALLLQAL